MENIIKKAIEGGYEGDEYGGEYTMEDYLYSKEKVVLDPLFWQAPQKAKDWNIWQMEDIRQCFFDEVFRTEGDEPMGWNSAVKYLEDLIK